MKHLNTEQLKKYGERQLKADELTLAVLHLDECGACFEAFREMFPALSNAAREVSAADFTAGEAEIFHLEYETHLRPFIDLEADEVTREIVESHLQNCSFCARAVRELREFSDGLKLRREIEKSDLNAPGIADASGDLPRRFTSGNSRFLFLSVAVVLVLGIGGWVIWRQTEPANFAAKIQTPTAAPQNSGNENSLNRFPENALAKQEVEENEISILPGEENSANKKIREVGDNVPESEQPENERLIAALPPKFRAEFQNALKTQKLNLPEFIAELRETDKLRGDSNNEKNIILSPNAQAVRNSRPNFSWRKFAAEGESYVVTIYDGDFNQIAVSPNLRETKWQSNLTLQRGKIYRWQIKTATSAENYSGRFKVLDGDALARLKTIENAASNFPLALGIAYASEGLLTEAERAFQKASKNNPREKLAKQLKESLFQKVRR